MTLMAAVAYTEVLPLDLDSIDSKAKVDEHHRLYTLAVLQIEQSQPYLVKKLGNGVLAVYLSFFDAIQSAYEQITLSSGEGVDNQLSGAWALRIGMCTGPVEIVQGECLGDTVNVAFRLCELASPNEIWADLYASDIRRIPPGFRYGQLGSIPIRGRTERSTVMKFVPLESINADQATQIGAVNESPADFLCAPKYLDLVYEHKSCRFVRSQFPVRIGRGEDAHFQLADDRVSRTHVVIEWRHNGPTVIDVSSFGTWVRFKGSESALLLRREFCTLQGEGELILSAALGAKVPTVVGFCVASD